MARTGTAAIGGGWQGRLSPAAWAARRGLHYGWVMVAITLVVVVVTAGVRSSAGVLIRPLEAEFGWSRGEISLVFSVALLVLAFTGPLSGKLVDRVGIRQTVLFGATVATIGVALTIVMQSLWQFHLFWGIILPLGSGCVSLVLGAAVANTWFVKQRGLVTGILGGGSSAGQLVFLPTLVWVTSQWGWRAALTLLVGLLAALLLPAAFIFVRNRPDELGLTAYGAGEVGEPATIADSRFTPMAEAIRTRDFWLLALTFAVCGFTTVGLIGTHFLPFAAEQGYSEGQAAALLSIIGGMNIVGTVSAGWLCDRYSPRRLLAGYYFLRALSLLALPALAATTSLPLMALFAIVFGFDFIATVPPTVMLTANRFGRRSVPVIYGWILFAHMIGGALAAALAGEIRDRAGSYTLIIYVAGFTALMAAALAFNIRGREQTPMPLPAPAAG